MSTIVNFADTTINVIGIISLIAVIIAFILKNVLSNRDSNTVSEEEIMEREARAKRYREKEAMAKMRDEIENSGSDKAKEFYDLNRDLFADTDYADENGTDGEMDYDAISDSNNTKE